MKIFYYGRYLFIIAIALILIDYLQGFIDFSAFISLVCDSYHNNKYYFFPLVIVSSIIETVFAFSFYFPGSVVLVTVIYSLSEEGSIVLILPCLAIWVGINFGCAINYILGIYFSSFVDKLGHKSIIKNARKILDNYGAPSAFLLSVHPNYIGTLYMVAGLIEYRINKMIRYSLVGITISVFLWSQIILKTSEMIVHSGANHTYILSSFCMICGIAWGIYKKKKLN